MECEENLLKLMEETANNVEHALVTNFDDGEIGFDEEDDLRI